MITQLFIKQQTAIGAPATSASICGGIKNTALALLAAYAITGFWYNLLSDFFTLFLDGNDGKWICYIAIFSSSPNFKNLLCSGILFYIYLAGTGDAQENGEKFKLFRLVLIVICVLGPGVVFYTMPFLYVVIGIVITALFLSCFAYAIYRWGILVFNCLGEGGALMCGFGSLFLCVGGIVCYMVVAGDICLCVIHGLDECYWRLSFDEYLNLVENDLEVLLRFITLFNIDC